MNQKNKLSRKLLRWLLAMGVALVVITSVAAGFQYFFDYIDQVKDLAFGYARTLAGFVDGDSIARYEQTLEKDAYYQNIQTYINAAQRQTDMVRYYICIPYEEGLFYIWNTGEKENAGSPGEVSPYPNDRIKETAFRMLRNNPKREFAYGKYGDLGRLISAYYPIFNSKGEAVALAGVDFSTDKQVFLPLIRFLLGINIGIALVIGLFLIQIYQGFRREAVRPIIKLQQGMRLYRQTMDSSAAAAALEDIRLKNEIGALTGDFITLMVEVDENTAEVARLTAERERIEAELNVATQIQTSILPRTFPPFPERREFDLYASMHPAKEVGGDFYDFFLIDDDHLGLVIADVSGKGVPAALFMVKAKTLIKYRARMGGTPGEIFSAVNDRLCEGNDNGMFVTAWMAILEISTGRGLAVNAGHENPVLRRSGGSYELLEYKHSPVLAFMKGIRYWEHAFQLDPGDRVFVYTDGVPEATNAAPELYGCQRMTDALNAVGSASCEETLRTLKRVVDDFVGDAPQFDDMTMLCLDYYGPD